MACSAEPLVAIDRIYAGASDKQFYCIDALTGEIKWVQKIGASIPMQAASDGERVYMVGLHNLVRAFDARSGNGRWQQGVPFRPFMGPRVPGEPGTSVIVTGPATTVHIFAARDGLEFRYLRGDEIGVAEWDATWAFYQETGSRKWGRPYLTREFFDLIGERMGDRLLLFLAYREGRPIAGALNLVGPDALYGRYWGCSEEHPFLHFNVCLYHSIDDCIRRGLEVFEGGAGGEHKIHKGFDLAPTYSMHWFQHPGLDAALRPILAAETAHRRAELAAFEGRR